MKTGAIGKFTNGIHRKSFTSQELGITHGKQAFSEVLSRKILRIDGLQRGKIIDNSFENKKCKKVRVRFRVISCDPMKADFKIWTNGQPTWLENVEIGTSWQIVEAGICSDEVVRISGSVQFEEWNFGFGLDYLEIVPLDISKMFLNKCDKFQVVRDELFDEFDDKQKL